MVCRAAFGHRRRLQDLCGKLSQRGSPEADSKRGPGGDNAGVWGVRLARHARACPGHPRLIPTAAAFDSLRHPRMSAIALTREVRAKRASKDGNMHRIRGHPWRPAQERGRLRMTVIVWNRWY